MKEKSWILLFAAVLISLSVVLYFIHFLIFQDSHHIYIYTLGDIAFIPIEILVVTLIVHRVLDAHNRKAKIEKLNMVIGTFFSAMGTWLLTYISDQDPHLDDLRENLIVSDQWTDEEFNRVNEIFRKYPADIDINMVDLCILKEFLQSREEFMIRLLENPILYEHERFTSLLQAVFHLTEELDKRPDVTSLPANDLSHLSGDIKRIYHALISQWLDYMQYLKKNYPYLFSLAMRTNPFDDTASPIIS
ncbi:MAG TPA: hypothetical protein VMW63_09240 [Methanoregulaceae archaeon]|nr:hypothetical protein [Methanoregulaceae archaeon]